jgi:histidinol-phosphate/aromatic aminotransferase/cobyric acid decarboxylase-like protein
MLKSIELIKEVYPRAGNFLLLTVDGKNGNARKLTDLLLIRYGILIKNVSSKFDSS